MMKATELRDAWLASGKIRICENGCWEWIGPKQSRGYGVVNLNGDSTLAHRLAYKSVKGLIQDGKVIRHKCDNPPCCNPAHLIQCTQAANMLDMKRKGRASRVPKANGDANGNSKLDAETVLKIRAAYATGQFTLAEVAQQFGVDRSNVGYIVKRKIWGWLPDANGAAATLPPVAANNPEIALTTAAIQSDARPAAPTVASPRTTHAHRR